MTSGSPAWKPQATLTEVTIGISSSSRPIGHGPKASPTSALRSIVEDPPATGLAYPQTVMSGGSRKLPSWTDRWARPGSGWPACLGRRS